MAFPMDENAARAYAIARETASRYSNMYTGTEHLLSLIHI